MEGWTLFLAEDPTPSPEFAERFPGVETLHGRLFVWPRACGPDAHARVFRFGLHPAYGPTYARVLASGAALEELWKNPAFLEAESGKKNIFRSAYLNGDHRQLEGVLSWAQRWGRLGEFSALEQALAPQRRLALLLGGQGVPFGFKDGAVWVGNPPALPVRSEEEARLVGEAYRWARRHRLPIAPLPREDRPDAPLTFRVGALPLRVVEGREGPLAAARVVREAGGGGKLGQNAVFCLERRRGEVVALPVFQMPSRKIKLVFDTGF